MALPISREQAWELVKRYNSDEKDLIHYLESEAIMRELAEHLNEDCEYWGMLGLLHDLDWGLTKNNSREHATKAPALLREKSFDNAFIETIVSHTYGFDCADNVEKKRSKKIEFALAASETLTGIIHAYALMREGRVSDMTVKGLMKKFKDKTFAAKCDREIVKEIEHLGLTLDEFFTLAIRTIQKIKNNVGLV